MRPFIKDNNGKPSVTLTAFVVGFIIVCAKLIFSGIQINDKLKLAEFDGTDFGVAIAALGAVYTLRKNSKKDEEKKD
jgi:hypothetical protein